MDLKPRELYPNNKITEAICQFTFKKSLENNLFDKFSSEIISTGQYVVTEKIPMFHITFNLNETETHPVPLNGLKIINHAGDKIIQVFSDNISVHQVGNYKSWEEFLEDIKKVYNEFRKVFDCEISRIDIRAINVFNFDLNENPHDFFTLHVNLPSPINSKYNYNFTIEKTYEENKSFGVIRGKCINQNESKNFILDLSYVLLAGEKSIDLKDESTIFAILETGHLKLHELFQSAINEETRKKIR
jgi:uncharacterized protein (TIGR04255 family)